MVIIPIAPMEKMEFSQTSQAVMGGQGTTVPFKNILQDAIQGLQETQAVTAEDSYHLAVGDVNDLAQVQINSMKAEAMLNTTVQLTTRIVNTYKEIAQMQV